MERTVPREKWLYDDRGMMKWMGWILSDASTYVEDEQKCEQLTPVKPEVDKIAIDKALQASWQNHLEVRLQFNILENNLIKSELIGEVVGFEANNIYLKMNDGRISAKPMDNIRHVELVRDGKWWSHDNAFG
ncbi:hypothetical protein RA086_11440 [Lactiplantibacillus sp. WILCCON 0030]|uniref:DNA-directed RNA polymerase beta subunit n=1 Tax=Lactiplantibacillus brownii TaxID=3069269 RepID=A0ABU1AB80_9LACO|nr:hypothetical protein [Lactiplantibacillus brownii]MDQ7938222.1 hypothetical protein [Lactiplantibacillus brownii]